MGIFDEISSQLTTAMKAKDKDRVTGLRAIRAAFLAATKEDGSKSLPDEKCVELLRRLEKQRRESIEAFESAGRDEQAAAERAEHAILQEFLPSLADEAQTQAWVEEAIAAAGAAGPGDAGRVMGALMKAHKGEVDGGMAKQIAAKLLAP